MAIVALQLVGLMSNNALAMSLLSTFFFHTALGVNGFIAIGIIIAATLLAILTATLVAWGAVRVRPLEVLRYE
jgi:ABC-type lipoprotein release transport system permease subunit